MNVDSMGMVNPAAMNPSQVNNEVQVTLARKGMDMQEQQAAQMIEGLPNPQANAKGSLSVYA